jgi:hypothetical protein
LAGNLAAEIDPELSDASSGVIKLCYCDDSPSGHGVCRGDGWTNVLVEQAMNTIIDLSSELLIDRSKIRNPYLRLLLTAIGEELARGSPWVAVNKKIASQYKVAGQPLIRQTQYGAALCA